MSFKKSIGFISIAKNESISLRKSLLAKKADIEASLSAVNAELASVDSDIDEYDKAIKKMEKTDGN